MTELTLAEQNHSVPSGGGEVAVGIVASTPPPPQHHAHDVIDVDKLIVKDLRKALQIRGLSVGGRKAELQGRLREHMATALEKRKAADGRKSSKQLLHHQPQDKVETNCAAPKSSNGEDVVLSNALNNPSFASKGEVFVKEITKRTDNEHGDWRVKAEERRKAALAIRASKKLKTENGAVKQPVITPVSNPYSSSKTPSDPYAKKASSTADWIPAVTTMPHSPANPYAKKSSPSTVSTSAAAAPSRSPAPRPKPRPTKQISLATSAWGDCRLDLWEALCTCGGERKSPDVRMCRCLGALSAGLGCEGCNAGVLLIKSGPRGNFWGCSQYKKRGCKHTMRFGPPHDAEAARRLAELRRRTAREAEREREERSSIEDPFEKEWRAVCRCDGAKALDTFECFMRSDGGCGMLPLCPKNTCGGCLFLHRSKYGNGRWWGCSNYKNGTCKFRKDYIEHRC